MNDVAMLYVPGIDQHKLDKILGMPEGSFILDLEDAVAVSQKPQARETVRAFLAAHGSEFDLHVRVNSLDTDHTLDDLGTVVVPGLSGIVLPKVVSAHDIAIADWLIGQQERRNGLEVGSIPIMAIIETAEGVARVDEIAGAAPRLRRLSFGAGDFSLDIGLDWPPLGGRLSATLISAKAALVLASRRHGLLPPHDSVYPDVRDLETLRLEAEEARGLGFSGKHAIHPAQRPVIEATFAPSFRQLKWAQRVVETFEESERNGIAAIQIEGRFIDYPVVARARQVLALAQVARRTNPEEGTR